MKSGILFIKFALVGVINTLFGYSCFAVLLYLGLHYTLCVILSTILGILFNFKTTGVIVFKSNDNKKILKFFINYTVICLLNIILLKIANVFDFNLYYAGFFATIICAIISFLVCKNWVFKENI